MYFHKVYWNDDEEDISYVRYLTEHIVDNHTHELVCMPEDSEEFQEALKSEQEWDEFNYEGMSARKRAKAHTKRIRNILKQSQHWEFDKCLLYWEKYNKDYDDAKIAEQKA